ncbi:MAG TPA: S41 family peptidase [Rudaea sp.]|nr:S41 family peptidase [Rudaea sp.]
MYPRSAFAFLLAVALMPAFAASTAVAPKASFSQPAMSPDASRIAFISGGAIWEVAAGGGAAHLLVADKGSDSRPLYSPNGRKLAFVSDATGNGDIYVLDLASGALSQVTFDDGAEQLDAWSYDGAWLYLSSGRDNVGGMQAVYRVRATGGTPMPVSLEAYRNESQAAPSPDGKTVALIGGGMGDFQWWRHGHSHIDEGAVWLLVDDGSHTYSRLTPDDARADWPMWAADGRSLFYMSDRSGAENIWHVQRDGNQSALTNFTDGRVLWPTISADGRAIAFERDFGIWTVATDGGAAHAVPIILAGAVAGPGRKHETLHGGFAALALSPDGKKLAFIAAGDVYAADAEKGGDAQRVTQTPAAEYGVIWAPDSKRIVYGSERDGSAHLYEYDFRSARETPLTDGDGEDTDAAISPDGKSLAFLRDGHTLEVLDFSSRTLRTLSKAHIDFHRPLNSQRPLAWSPDGRYIVYLAYAQRMFRNAYAVSVKSGETTSVSFLANTFADDVTWGADGKSLLFITGQRTEPGQIARIDLVPETPQFLENKFLDLFKEATPNKDHHNEQNTAENPKGESKSAAKDKSAHKSVANVSITAAGIRERLQLLPTGLNAQSIAISPDGKTLVITAEVAGKTNLYAWSLDPLDTKPRVARQLTSTSDGKDDAQFSADGKQVFYLDGGKVFSVPLAEGGKAKPVKVDAQADSDFAITSMAAFTQAWTWLRDNFHDPKMHGVDWNAMRTMYAPLIAGAPNQASFLRLMNQLVGELDASHSGVRSGEHAQTFTGHLGLIFDRAAYEQHGTLRITDVLPLSPADVSGKIHPGDTLVAVDGTKLDAHANLAALLAHRIDRKTVLQIDSGRGVHTVDVKPVDSRTRGELAYNAWAQRSRAYVDRISGGKLGYVHIRDMSMGSLQRMYKDLDAQNSTRMGVVIDVRNNFGGFVNAYALDVLSRRHYLNMTFRGFDNAQPARSILGQRALERPTVLVTNRVTLSDGEDFSQGYRALGLGKIVGEPTAGWIIYTSNEKLIDGSTVRLPFITVTTADGKPMEGHPRPVDVPVARALGEAYRGTDSDLDAAVHVLLQQFGSDH